MKDSPTRQNAAPSAPDSEGDRASDGSFAPEQQAYRGLSETRSFLAERPTWFFYFFAVVLTSGMIGVRRSLDLFDTGLVPFALFYPVVLICTLFGGIGPGAVSLALAAVATIYFWIEPQGIFALHGTGLVNLLLFIATNAMNIYLAHRLRYAHGRLRKSEARLSLSQDVGRIGIWDFDIRTGNLWWSDTLRTVIGMGPEQRPSAGAFMKRIHEADRPRAQQAFEDAQSGLNRLDVDFRFKRDDGTMIWLASRAELFRDADGKPTRLLGINFDATPIRTVEGERDQATALLKTFFDSLPGAAFAKDLEGRYLIGNPIFAAAMGHTEETFSGKTDLELLADEEQARAIMANDQAVIAGGTARQLEESLLLPNGDMSYWLAVKAPFRDAEGQPQGIMGISLDVTDRRKAEERLRFLADEVDHRAKNLLSVVLSLVRLTKVDDVAAFKAAVSGRIEALARAHTLLAANRWQGVNIAALVHDELEPFRRAGSDRICLSGPSLMLEPNASQALAMVVHELAINAAMYGALSVEEGRLTVAWEVAERETGSVLELEWTEAGGPEVVAPAEPGFGSTAIRGAIEHQLGGEFELSWLPTGVTCRIAFPLERHVPAEPMQDPTGIVDEPSPESASGTGAELRGKRVMVVEDEALIALTLMDAISEMGCEILGPASTVAAAVDLARRDPPPDLAVLDVNLAGASSAPVAQALRSLGVPFVYCTGYAEPASQIEPDLRAEMLTKPIDPRALEAALRGALGEQQEPAPMP